jgi:transposase
MSEKNVPNRRYTDEFKEEAARLASSVGHNEAARRLGVPVATIGNWARRQRNRGVASAPAAATPAARAKPAVSELEAENSRLRKELASVKLELGASLARRAERIGTAL